MTFPIESTSATQASKAREGGEELEIDFCRSITNVGIKTQEKLGRQPQSELQPNYDTKVKAPKVLEVSLEIVEESPPRSQPKGVLNKVVKLIIKFLCDLVG